MEVDFSALKQKDVISLTDGKHLGKARDISLTFPENRVLGITVTGGKGFKFSRQSEFIPIGCITKIGEDAILVNYIGDGGRQEKPRQEERSQKPQPPFNAAPPHSGAPARRSFEEYE